MSLERDALNAAVAAHGTVVRVLVAEAAGSVPRGPGTAMLIWQDGQHGTIGGGALELAATRAARALLTGGGARIDRHALGPGLGQCCGGAVTLVSEVWNAARLRDLPDRGGVSRRLTGDAAQPLALQRAARRLRSEGASTGPILRDGWLLEQISLPQRDIWIWGAGHVGRALVDVLSPLPDIALSWIDTGPARFPDTAPAAVRCLPATDPVALVPHAPATAEHLVLTYSHALDLALCHALLGHGFRAAGLIGSATKWARFRRRLAEMGHAPERIAQITCPIGAPSLGKAPQAIAIGVAAALLAPAALATKDQEVRQA